MDQFFINNLITTQEYSKLKHHLSYTLNIKAKGKELLYLGVSHGRDPLDRKFRKIESLFRKFVRKHAEQNVINILENYIPSSVLSRDEMIKKHGETGLMFLLSMELGIKVVCPEPSPSESIKFVESRGRDRVDILLWIFLNILNSRLGKQKTVVLEEAHVAFLSVYKINREQQVFKCDSKADLEFIFKRRLKEILLFNDDLFQKSLEEILMSLGALKIKKLQDPFLKFSAINLIGSDFNLARDYFVGSEIIDQLFNKRKNVFAVFGLNHVICQEKAIRMTIKKLRHQKMPQH